VIVSDMQLSLQVLVVKEKQLRGRFEGFILLVRRRAYPVCLISVEPSGCGVSLLGGLRSEA